VQTDDRNREEIAIVSQDVYNVAELLINGDTQFGYFYVSARFEPGELDSFSAWWTAGRLSRGVKVPLLDVETETIVAEKEKEVLFFGGLCKGKLLKKASTLELNVWLDRKHQLLIKLYIYILLIDEKLKLGSAKNIYKL